MNLPANAMADTTSISLLLNVNAERNNDCAFFPYHDIFTAAAARDVQGVFALWILASICSNLRAPFHFLCNLATSKPQHLSQVGRTI